MTKGQKLYNALVVSLTMHYPHLYDMTVSDARHTAYLYDNFVLHSILNAMISIYPEHKDKTFRFLESHANEMEYKEHKKKNNS
jgi:hypothetical protein